MRQVYEGVRAMILKSKVRGPFQSRRSIRCEGGGVFDKVRLFATWLLVILSLACGKSEKKVLPSSPEDNIRPTIEVSGYVPYVSIASGVTEVEVKVTDDNGVKDVEIYVDDTLVHERIAATTYSDGTIGASFTYPWDTTQLRDGTRHILRIEAYDTSGNSNEVRQDFLVDNYNFGVYPIALSEPFNVTDTSVTLSWSRLTDSAIVEYVIFRHTFEAPWIRIVGLSSDQYAYVDTRLSSQTLYYYRVYGRNKDDIYMRSNDIKTTTAILPPDTGWSIITSPKPAKTAEDNLVSVNFISIDDAWAFGSWDRKTYILHFDGKSWWEMDTGIQENQDGPILSSHFTSSNNGWVLTSLSLYHYDGNSWSKWITMNLSLIRKPKAIFFLDQGHEGWIAGDSIYYYRYKWRDLGGNYIGTIDGLRSVHFNSPDDGWFVGSRKEGRPEVHHFSTEFLNRLRVDPISPGPWERVYAPYEDGYLLDVYSLAPDNVWMVGGFAGGKDEGLILHWNGVSLERIYSPTFFPLNSVHFISPDDGWAVGNSGTILHYDGANWENVPSSTSEHLNSVSFISSDIGWAVGNRETILMYRK